MEGRDLLHFQPSWHEMGDADHRIVAIAYGVIAMATVWVVESLAHRVLFTSKYDFSLSEACAFVTFKGCSWCDLMRWMYSKAWLGVQTESKSNCEINRRACMGILLRLVVVLVEIAIIFASVPRTMSIMSEQVGSSQMNFRGTGQKLIPDMSTGNGNMQIRMTPCFIDSLSYSGFTATAHRKICYSSLSLKYHTGFAQVEDSVLKSGNKTGDKVFQFKYDMSQQAFTIYSIMETTLWTYTHTIHLKRKNVSASLDDVFFTLPPPPDVVRQAIDVYLGHHIFKTICNVLTDAPLKRTVAYLKCTPLSTDLYKDFDDVFIWTLLTKASTMKVRANESRDSLRDGEYNHEVGTLNRPRLCIFPALILLASLASLDMILYFMLGSENIAMKMFRVSKEVAGASRMSNPLFTESKIVELSSRGCNGSLTVGYASSGTSIYDVDNAVH